MRLFLDANVLFTAAISPEGNGRALVDLARAGACGVVSSPHAMDEARPNVRVKRPQHVDSMEALLRSVARLGEVDTRLVAWARQVLPPKDAPILAAAIAERVDILVTGDRRHVADLYGRSVEGVEVLPPRDALARVLNA